MKHNDMIQFPDSSILLVLALLEDADKYGYEMIRVLELRADETFARDEGTLYPILHMLEQRGEICAYEKNAESGRLRKYYRLTKQGVRTLSRKRREHCAKIGKVVGGEACAHRPD